MQGLVDRIKAGVLARLARTPEEFATLEQQISTVFDVHRGIQTSATELTALKHAVQPIAAQKRILVDTPDADGKATGTRTGDFVYDVPVQAELEAMLAADPNLASQLATAADAWAASRPDAGSHTYVYADISDGAVLRNHAQLGECADRSDGAVRLAFILYYDDLEVVNPLGAFHGKHKLGMFYWALVNVAAETRMAFSNLHLATVALVSDIDYYGINQIVSGLPEDSSFGSSMTALNMGVTLGGELFRGWLILLSADYPAAGLMAGFKKSVSASLYCRECDVDKRDGDTYPKPNSFMDENRDLEQLYLLREQAAYREQLAHHLTLQGTREQEAYLTSLGVSTFDGHAFTRIPLFDLCTMIPCAHPLCSVCFALPTPRTAARPSPPLARPHPAPTPKLGTISCTWSLRERSRLFSPPCSSTSSKQSDPKSATIGT